MITWQQTIAFLSLRKKSYQTIFSAKGAFGSAAMKDLAKFCRAFETCVVPDNRDLSLVLEGRREVWIRIQQHLHLNEEDLAALYKAVVQGEQ